MKRSILILSLFASLSGHAAIPESQAIKAILGEAGGEPFAAQCAIASSIRLRNSLQGIYGVKNPCVKRAPSYAILRARKAWQASAFHDYAQGCRYFGCPADRSYFIHNGFRPVFTIGQTTFYK